MPKQISPSPKLRFFDDDGVPLVGGKLYTYAAGTTTPIATYTDSTGGTANANPVILDARGEADVWLTAATTYKFVLDDADDVTIWTVDNLTSIDIYAENITWTGQHIFSNDVTFNDTVHGAVTFDGLMTIDDNLYVIQNLTVDGNVSFGGTMSVDSIDVPLVTLDTAGTIADDGFGVIEVTGANNVTITVDTSAFTFDFMETGLLRLPVETPVNDLDAASKGYVDAQIAATVTAGMLPVAMGAVVSNALVTGAVGVTSVNHSGTGTYVITLSSATTSTGKTIVMTTVRNTGLDKNWTAYPTVDSTTQVTVKTGGGNTYSASDKDFNFVVYSLP